MGNVLSSMALTMITVVFAGVNGQYQVFVRDFSGATTAIDLPKDAKLQNLVEAVQRQVSLFSLKHHSLLFKGEDIIMDPHDDLADLGIGNEAVIDISRRMTDTMMLFKMFEHAFTDPSRFDSIEWFQVLKACFNEEEGSQNCNVCENVKLKNIFSCIGSDDEAVTNINAYSIGFDGDINLNFLPQTVKNLNLERNKLDHINLNQLKGRGELKSLRLSKNKISSFRLSDLVGTKVFTLLVSHQYVPSDVDVRGTKGMPLAQLYVDEAQTVNGKQWFQKATDIANWKVDWKTFADSSLRMISLKIHFFSIPRKTIKDGMYGKKYQIAQM